MKKSDINVINVSLRTGCWSGLRTPVTGRELRWWQSVDMLWSSWIRTPTQPLSFSGPLRRSTESVTPVLHQKQLQSTKCSPASILQDSCWRSYDWQPGTVFQCSSPEGQHRWLPPPDRGSCNQTEHWGGQDRPGAEILSVWGKHCWLPHENQQNKPSSHECYQNRSV